MIPYVMETTTAEMRATKMKSYAVSFPTAWCNPSVKIAHGSLTDDRKHSVTDLIIIPITN